MPAQTPPAIVVVAKAPVPGRVKTRLTVAAGGHPALTAGEALAVHTAMLACVLARAGHAAAAAGSRRVLAVDEPAAMPASLVPAGWELVPQGGGDLGERLVRVWETAVGADVGAVLLGVDSPDVPAAALEAACGAAAGRADGGAYAVGPTPDGGYWTLAGPRLDARLFTRIDWGTAGVYDQTRAAAAAAGLPLVDLPTWADVDDPADLAALQARLTGSTDGEDPAIQRLAAALARPTGPTP